MTECFCCGKVLDGKPAYQVIGPDATQYLICSGRCLEDLGKSEQGQGR